MLDDGVSTEGLLWMNRVELKLGDVCGSFEVRNREGMMDCGGNCLEITRKGATGWMWRGLQKGGSYGLVFKRNMR